MFQDRSDARPQTETSHCDTGSRCRPQVVRWLVQYSCPVSAETGAQERRNPAEPLEERPWSSPLTT